MIVRGFSTAELARYTMRQLETFFPDGRSIDENGFTAQVAQALERVEYCFSRIALPRYTEKGNASLDVLHADQYCSYLYILSNTIFRAGWDITVASKLYALNKALNGINCLYDTELPEIFCIVHGVGTVLGKAAYKNYLVVVHGVTVGAIGGIFPTMSERLILSAGSSIIGESTIGENVMLEPHTHLVKTSVPANTRIGGQPGNYTSAPNGGRAMAYYFKL